MWTLYNIEFKKDSKIIDLLDKDNNRLNLEFNDKNRVSSIFYLHQRLTNVIYSLYEIEQYLINIIGNDLYNRLKEINPQEIVKMDSKPKILKLKENNNWVICKVDDKLEVINKNMDIRYHIYYKDGKITSISFNGEFIHNLTPETYFLNKVDIDIYDEIFKCVDIYRNYDGVVEPKQDDNPKTTTKTDNKNVLENDKWIVSNIEMNNDGKLIILENKKDKSITKVVIKDGIVDRVFLFDKWTSIKITSNTFDYILTYFWDTCHDLIEKIIENDKVTNEPQGDNNIMVQNGINTKMFKKLKTPFKFIDEHGVDRTVVAVNLKIYDLYDTKYEPKFDFNDIHYRVEVVYDDGNFGKLSFVKIHSDEKFVDLGYNLLIKVSIIDSLLDIDLTTVGEPVTYGNLMVGIRIHQHHE